MTRLLAAGGLQIDAPRRLLGRLLRRHPDAVRALAAGRIRIIGPVSAFAELIQTPAPSGEGFPERLEDCPIDHALATALLLAALPPDACDEARRGLVQDMRAGRLAADVLSMILVALGDIAVGRTDHVRRRRLLGQHRGISLPRN